MITARWGMRPGGSTPAGVGTPFLITTPSASAGRCAGWHLSSLRLSCRRRRQRAGHTARSHGTSSRNRRAASVRLRRELTTTGVPTLRAIGTPIRYPQYRKQWTTSGEASRNTPRSRRISGIGFSSTERRKPGNLASTTRIPEARATALWSPALLRQITVTGDPARRAPSPASRSAAPSHRGLKLPTTRATRSGPVTLSV